MIGTSEELLMTAEDCESTGDNVGAQVFALLSIAKSLIELNRTISNTRFNR